MEYPARLEAWVWQHPDMPAPDMVATALPVEQASKLITEFRNNLSKQKALKTIHQSRQSMAHLPYELWLETVLNLCDWDDDAFSSREREDGVDMLNYLAGQVGKSAGSLLSARAANWLNGFYTRLSDHVKDAEETRDACWVLGGYLAGQAQRVSEPSVQTIGLYQRGASLQLLHEKAGQHTGSPLAVISSGDMQIRLAPEAEEDWAGFLAPDWTTNWGTDEFGPWAEFT
ncbi:MAG: hypothetical protein GY809_09055, partial [Planctomycetes bacterium]|nr:hypothetical protein [Planctomycetota bacterium]